MLDLKFVRTHLKDVKAMLQSRGYPLDLSAFEAIDKKRRDLLPELESLRHLRNKVSQDIAEMKKKGEDASRVITEMKQTSSEIKEMEALLSGVEEELGPLLMVVPNMPDDSEKHTSNRGFCFAS